MNKKTIIQLRDDKRSVLNAEIIDGMIAEDHISAETILKNSQYLNLTLFLNGQEKKFFYTIQSELDHQYYCEDAERIRFVLNKIGGNL